MYKLNNISFSTYGIYPGRTEGSTLALEGMLSMPARIGKTSHNWADEPGNEPYVSSTEIRHGGRDIAFTGLVLTGSKAEALDAVYAMYNDMGAYTGLIPLETPYGTFQVYVSNEVDVERIAFGWCTVRMVFRQPEPQVPAVVIPAGGITEEYNLDGVSFQNLGAFVSSVSGNFSRPQPKEMQFTAWSFEGYQVTKPQDRMVTVSLVFHSDSYAALENNVNILYAMLARQGLRVLQVDGVERYGYNTQGFQVTGIQVGDNIAVCQVKLEMIVTGIVGETQENVLVDFEYNPIVENDYTNIKVQ